MSANDSGETGKFKTSVEKINENNRLNGLFFYQYIHLSAPAIQPPIIHTQDAGETGRPRDLTKKCVAIYKGRTRSNPYINLYQIPVKPD